VVEFEIEQVSFAKMQDPSEQRDLNTPQDGTKSQNLEEFAQTPERGENVNVKIGKMKVK